MNVAVETTVLEDCASSSPDIASVRCICAPVWHISEARCAVYFHLGKGACVQTRIHLEQVATACPNEHAMAMLDEALVKIGSRAAATAAGITSQGEESKIAQCSFLYVSVIKGRSQDRASSLFALDQK